MAASRRPRFWWVASYACEFMDEQTCLIAAATWRALPGPSRKAECWNVKTDERKQ